MYFTPPRCSHRRQEARNVVGALVLVGLLVQSSLEGFRRLVPLMQLRPDQGHIVRRRGVGWIEAVHRFGKRFQELRNLALLAVRGNRRQVKVGVRSR